MENSDNYMHERENTPCKLHTLENFAVQDILAYLDPWITFLLKVKDFDIRRETTLTETDHDSLKIQLLSFMTTTPLRMLYPCAMKRLYLIEQQMC